MSVESRRKQTLNIINRLQSRETEEPAPPIEEEVDQENPDGSLVEEPEEAEGLTDEEAPASKRIVRKRVLQEMRKRERL